MHALKAALVGGLIRAAGIEAGFGNIVAWSPDCRETGTNGRLSTRRSNQRQSKNENGRGEK
jgi:hypothetical protein